MTQPARKPHAIPGNKNGTKVKDPDVRQEAFRQYCQHLASGYPKEAFFFDHPTQSVCYKTLERYLAASPSEFPAILIERAKAARLKYWFDEGKMLMKGGYKGGSPVVWQTIMRNMFKDMHWDVEDKRVEVFDNSKLDALRTFFESVSRVSVAPASTVALSPPTHSLSPLAQSSSSSQSVSNPHMLRPTNFP